MHLVVLIRRHIEERVAVLAGKGRRAGIGADQEGLGFRDGPVDRLQDVGEDRADHEVDLVALEQALDLGHRRIRLEFVIDHDDLDIAAAHLAAEILHRERKAVANLLAKRGGGARQGHDHAQLDLVLGEGRAHRGAEQQGGRGQGQLRLHDLSPVTIRACVASRVLRSKLMPMMAARGKQSSWRRHPAGRRACKRRANCLKPKEIGRAVDCCSFRLAAGADLFEAQNIGESVPAPMPAVSDCIKMLDSETKAVETPEDHAEELRLWLRLSPARP